MAADGTVIMKPPSEVGLKTRPTSAKDASIRCFVRFRGWLSAFSMQWTPRWVIPARLPSSVWLHPSKALLARTSAAKSNRPGSLGLEEDFPGRRFFTVPPSIKKRTPADELPGFPISYLDQAIRAGSRGEREQRKPSCWKCFPGGSHRRTMPEKLIPRH
jgi:hypothetical protein